MNSYEAKQEAKRERLREAAEKRRLTSETLYNDGKTALEQIPFGQPILVGHHSERADRAYRSRAVGKIDRAFELSREADELEARAASVGTAGISSDDPEAIEKLQAKLEKLREAHALMVQTNRDARTARQPRPFASYQLSNSNANIHRIERRIEQLAKLRMAPANVPITGNGWSITEDADDNRILIEFHERQPQEITQLLRSRAFLWSPSRTAWVRKLTENARFAARQIATALSENVKADPN